MTTTTKKTTTKAIPAKKADTTPKAPTRKELLAALDKHGYTGPTSFTATALARVVLWLDSRAPKDQTEAIPMGVLYAVHPDLRPAPKAKEPRRSATYVKGYDAAMTDLRAFVATAKSVKDVSAHLDAYLTQDVSA